MSLNGGGRLQRKPSVVSNEKIWPDDFCTQCKDDLENFCFSHTAKDIEAIRELFERCKKEGRFSGGTCAKLFIAGQDMFE